MFVNIILLGSNPFFEAYLHSDVLGRMIFLGLAALSIITWIVLIHKVLLAARARKNSMNFRLYLDAQKGSFLNIEYPGSATNKSENPFHSLYLVLKKQAVDILNKNRRFASSKEEGESKPSYLSPSDIDIVESHLATTIASETKYLEKNIYILATVVTLAPFLGLLGTVWGILTTFNELQSQAGSNANQVVLSGLSLALATTVLGLVDAIPALIGYNYLKNAIRDFQTDMECFSNVILASLEMQYRKVDVE